MKKQLQLILVVGLLLPSSTGVLLASSADCRVWVAQTVETAVMHKRHYSKKVLATWARWRARHPNAKPVARKSVLRPGSLSRAQIPDVLGFYCDATVPTVDDVIATLLTPAESETAPAAPDEATGTDDSPGLYALTTDAALPPDAPTPAFVPPPLFGGPGSFGAPPALWSPPQGTPPIGNPPTSNPPTTGSSVPPPPIGPPVAVAAEPSSLLLLGTGIVAATGALRRRKFAS